MTTGTGAGAGRDPLDVLVVGAGPTGLALGLALQAFGIRFRVVDRQRSRVRESRALAVQPRTLEVLANFGVTDELVARGNRAVRLQMHVGRRDVPVRLFDIGSEDTAYPYLLFLAQAETERILEERLGGVSAGGGPDSVPVERGVELVGLSNGTEIVTCQLRHDDGLDETVEARYVVGCDGPGSTVRQSAGIPFEGSAYPQSFVLADLEADGIEPGWVHAFLAPRGILFFFPLGSPSTWRLITMRPPGGPTPSAEQAVTLDEVQDLVDGYVRTPVRLHDPVWMTNFRLHHRAARHYRAGRLFVAGDAAHVHSPAGGQGMNTGIQDAVNLGWKLGLVVRGEAESRLLDTYDPERSAVGRFVLRFTDRAFTIGTSTRSTVRFARTRIAPLLIPLVLRSRAGRTYAFRTVSELGIRYRGSPLSVDAPDAPPHGPRAGDRIPDAPVMVEGRTATLHACLTGAHYQLLVCGPAAAWPAAAVSAVTDRYVDDVLRVHRLSREGAPGVLHDPDGTALHRLGLTEADAALYLVRPDGYLGFTGGAGALARLQTYLGDWLTAG